MLRYTRKACGTHLAAQLVMPRHACGVDRGGPLLGTGLTQHVLRPIASSAHIGQHLLAGDGLAHRPQDTVGRRMLTSAVFAFFVTASNDLAAALASTWGGGFRT